MILEGISIEPDTVMPASLESAVEVLDYSVCIELKNCTKQEVSELVAQFIPEEV